MLDKDKAQKQFEKKIQDVIAEKDGIDKKTQNCQKNNCSTKELINSTDN